MLYKINSYLLILFLILGCNGAGSGDSKTDGGGSTEDNEQVPDTNTPGDQSVTWLDGEITTDTTWEDTVYVGYIEVQAGATLTILPGTQVRFRVDRDYKTQNKGGLGSAGGTIKAIGTANKQIFFTAHHKSPINGDWYGISLQNTTTSEFKYTVIEYAELGLEQFDSKVSISKSIIRWNNTEGLYAERSEPIFSNNIFYENAYHGIALEQFNTNVQINDNYFREGYVAVHTENSVVTYNRNYFENYVSYPITSGLSSTLTINDSDFINTNTPQNILITDVGTTLSESNSNTDINNAVKPNIDFPLSEKTKLNYKPATESTDLYSYYYANSDATRKVISKIGKGTGLKFGWALMFYNGYLWRFSLGQGEYGNGLDFIRINPADGSFIKFKTDLIMNPRGLTHDGVSFWVNDFSEKKLFKFSPPSVLSEGNPIENVTSYDIPETGLGGTMGMTFANGFLYLVNRDQSKMYKINPADPGACSISCPTVNLERSVGNDITWDGTNIWSTATDKALGKFTLAGEYLGKIYPVAYDAWAITWDPVNKKLWTLQKTCELWDDDKLFQIEVLGFIPKGQ